MCYALFESLKKDVGLISEDQFRFGILICINDPIAPGMRVTFIVAFSPLPGIYLD